MLKRLAEGKVYKQIAHELELSTSTVRTHLHNIYGKLGAVDRAQAVLIATERGWLLARAAASRPRDVRGADADGPGDRATPVASMSDVGVATPWRPCDRGPVRARR